MKSFRYIKNIAFCDYEKKHMKLDVFLNRWFAIFTVYIFQFLPITPNIVTMMAFLVTFCAGLFFLVYNPWLFLIGIGLLYLGKGFDYVDGTLARTKGTSSKMVARFLDDVFHQVSQQFLFMFIGLGGYFVTGDITYFYLGIICLISQLILMYLSQFRKGLLCNFMNIKLINEDWEGNPLIKKKNLLYRLTVFPMKQYKLIFLGLVICSFWIPSIVYNSLLLYAPFLFFRTLGFFITTYSGLKKIEKEGK